VEKEEEEEEEKKETSETGGRNYSGFEFWVFFNFKMI